MLGGQNQQLDAGLLEHGGPLAGVEVGGVEEAGILRALAPLAVGKGVNAEMRKRNDLVALPGELLRAGNRQGGTRRFFLQALHDLLPVDVRRQLVLVEHQQPYPLGGGEEPLRNPGTRGQIPMEQLQLGILQRHPGRLHPQQHLRFPGHLLFRLVEQRVILPKQFRRQIPAPELADAAEVAHAGS